MIICSPQLGLNPKSVLGGEVFDYQILKGLAKKGVKIEIILPKNKPYDKNVKNWSITKLWASHFPAILGNLIFLPPLLKVYQKRKFQILRIHQTQFTGIAAILFKWLKKDIKLVAIYHQFPETNFWIFSKFINNFWDHIICDSQNVKDLINQKYRVPKSKITVVHNGIPSYLKPTVKDKKLLSKLKLKKKFVLLFMGRFIKRKNPLFLLEVLYKLNSKEVVIIFWGEGPLQKEIVEKAKELKLENQIMIQKPVFGKEKNKIHNLADIFVHPALDEGFALAPLEAMACAKPIIITDGYSAKEAVDDGINGHLCYSNDTNHWYQKLKELISDQSLRKKMSKASLTKVKKEFQWDKAVRKHIEVFKKLENETN